MVANLYPSQTKFPILSRKKRGKLQPLPEWGPGTKISPGGATVIRNRKFAPYWRSPLRQLLRICFVQMNISHGPFPNCERSWEEGMCACREEKKTSSPGKMHVLRTHFSTSRHTTLRHFHCIKINAEDSLLRFHKVKPVGLSKLPVPLTVAPPGRKRDSAGTFSGLLFGYGRTTVWI